MNESNWNRLLLGIISLQFLFISILLHGKYKDGDLKAKRVVTVSKKTYSQATWKEIHLNFSTSVFCTGRNKTDRECRFTNLCYDPLSEEFLFFHGNQTKQHGLPKFKTKSPLLDLSSVDDHNAKYFTYTDSKAQLFINRKMQFLSGSSILFHRFNPENLMHVLHDDLLPYFFTKRKHFFKKDIRAIYLDGREQGPYFELYQLFMDRIKTKDNLKALTCFQDLIVGVSKQTTWYQYGFKKPQGPICTNDFPLEELHYFRDRLLSLLGVHERRAIPSIVLFTRQETRRIVNDVQLALKLSMKFKMTVSTHDLQLDSFKDIIQSISKATILIGVHGAHLVTSLFLPPGSMLVEIFPFGVPSENYTPYKTLATLLNISYISWENNNENYSISYPGRPANLGGILHLPETAQKKIRELRRIPPHLCCHDPYWLFRIFQDTRVDIDDIIRQIDVLLKLPKSEKMFLLRPYFYPKTVRNISCKYNEETKTVLLEWSPPLNCMSPKKLTYEIILKGSTTEGAFEKLLNMVEKTFINVFLDKLVTLDVFIRSNLIGVSSEFSQNIQCL